MLFTKLKVVMVVLVVETLSGAAGLIYQTQATEPRKTQQTNERPKAPKTEEKEDKDKLQGTWRLVALEMNGLKFGEGRPEIKDTRLAVEKSSFTLFGKSFHSPNVPLPPEDIKYVGAFTLDTKKNPKVLALTWETNPWNDKKDFSQRGIYALDGDSLKWCLNLDDEDNKLPTDLSANFGSKRRLLTFKRVPPSEKGGEKKQQPAVPDDVKAKPQSKSAEPPNEGKLQGTWRMVTAEADGFRNGEGRPELKDNRLVIEKSSFTLFYALNVTLNSKTLELEKAETTTSAGTFTLDAKQTPNVIVLTWKESPWNGKKDFTQKAIYAMEGDTLKLCLRLDDDGKKAPAEFSANAGSKRAFWTFKRVPPNEKGGEKKP